MMPLPSAHSMLQSLYRSLPRFLSSLFIGLLASRTYHYLSCGAKSQTSGAPTAGTSNRLGARACLLHYDRSKPARVDSDRLGPLIAWKGPSWKLLTHIGSTLKMFWWCSKIWQRAHWADQAPALAAWTPATTTARTLEQGSDQLCWVTSLLSKLCRGGDRDIELICALGCPCSSFWG